MTQSEREKAAYPSDRRSASAKDNGITPSEFPIVTKASYLACCQKPAAMVDKRMRSLCLARAGLATALLRIDKAMLDHNPQVNKDALLRPLWNKLRSIRKTVEKEQLKFPLTIK